MENKRARRRGAVGRFVHEDIHRLFTSQNGICACGCGKPLWSGYHIDHRVPLSKGGTNWPENLQLLTPSCNLKKGAKT